MQLQKTQRHNVKLRLGISGASGFGKTYSALQLAYGMTQDWSKIAVIDTENASASLYSDLGNFNVLNINPPYSPERYIEAIKMCEKANMEVIIIDSSGPDRNFDKANLVTLDIDSISVHEEKDAYPGKARNIGVSLAR